jgi:putative ABC transport system permease protein
MARINLRGRGIAPVFAMIALFVGVVSLTFASAVTLNAERLVVGVESAMPEDNLVLLAPAGAGSRVVDAARAAGAVKISAGYQTRARSVQVVESPEKRLPALLFGRSQLTGYAVEGARWGSRPDGVYTARFYGQMEGKTLEITMLDGSIHRLPVVGMYDEEPGMNFQMESGILLSSDQILAMAAPDQEQVLACVPEEKLETAIRGLSEALPEATVINRAAYLARFTDMYHNLFWLAASMAGLALLAGVLLVANSVSLAMIHRHHEMGLLRALGYSRWHVLTMLMVEYTLMAVIALAAGLGVVRGYVWLVGLQNPMAGALLAISPQTAGLVTLTTLGLTLLAVLLVTWNPTRVSPLVVLNDKE